MLKLEATRPQRLLHKTLGATFNENEKYEKYEKFLQKGFPKEKRFS